MLVLSRKPGEKVQVGAVTLQVVAIQGNRVRLAIEAPEQVAIVRAELGTGCRGRQAPSHPTPTAEAEQP